MKRHILVVSHVHEGGEWIATCRLINAVQDSPVSPRFSLAGLTDGYIPKQGPRFQHKEYIVSSHSSPPLSYYKNLIGNIVNMRSVINIMIAKEDIDCFICTNYFMVLCCLGVKKSKKIPILFFFHGIQSVPFASLKDVNHREITTKLLERISFLSSNIIVVPAKTALRRVLSYVFPFGDQKKMYIVPNFIPNRYFKIITSGEEELFKKYCDIPNNNKVILYSGRVSVRKGLENLLISFNMLSPKLNGITLVLAYPATSADNTLLRQLYRKAETYGIVRQIRFISDFSEDQLIQLYHIANVSVLASDIETAPLSLIESLACGTPVLGTKTGNMPTILARINTRLILENNSSEEIYNKLHYWLYISVFKRLEIQNKCRVAAREFIVGKSVVKFNSLMSCVGYKRSYVKTK